MTSLDLIHLLLCFLMSSSLASIEYRGIGDSFKLIKQQFTSGATGIWSFVSAADGQTTIVFNVFNHPGGVTLRNGRLVVSRRELSQTCFEYTLSIKPIKQEDFGDYVWSLSAVTPGACTSAADTTQLVQVVRASQPVITCGDLTDGTRGSCICSSTGKPPPDFTMTFNGNQIASNEYQFKPVVWEQTEGKSITCTVSQPAVSHSVSTQHTISNVKYCPRFNPRTEPSSPGTYNVKRGSKITLKCESQPGYPDPSLTWLIANTSTALTGSGSIQYDLTIRSDVEPFCRMKTASLNCTKESKIKFNTIYGATSVQVTGGLDVSEFGSTVLTCSADCKPTCSFRWTTSMPGVTGSGNRLELMNISSNLDQLKVTCIASNQLRPDIGQAEDTSISSSEQTLTVSYGPYTGRGTLNINSTTTKLERLSNGTYRLLTAVNTNIPPISCQATCNPSCSYTWHPAGLTHMSSSSIGSISHMGYKQYVCRGSNSKTGVSKDVQTLHVFVNAPVVSLQTADITALSVRLEWSLSYVPPTPLTVTVVVKQLTTTGWQITPTNITVNTTTPTHSALVLGLQQKTTYTYRVVNQINGKVQSSAESMINITTEALPVVTNVAAQQEGSNVTFTWKQSGGDVSHVEICVQPESWTSGCNITKRYTLQETTTSRLRRSSITTHSASVQVPASQAAYRYRIALYDNGILLFTSNFSGAAVIMPYIVSPPENDALIISLSTVFSVLFVGVLVAISVVVIRRRRGPSKQRNGTKVGEQNGHGSPYQDIPLDGVPSGSGSEPKKPSPAEPAIYSTVNPVNPTYSIPMNKGEKQAGDRKKNKKMKKGEAKKNTATNANDIATYESLEQTGSGSEPKKPNPAEPAIYSTVNPVNPTYSTPMKKGEKQAGDRKKNGKMKKGAAKKKTSTDANDGATYERFEQTGATNVYANSNLEAAVYSNVEQPKEEFYANVNPIERRANMIQDSAKEHPDWKENADGLVYEDVQTIRPVLPDNEQQPIHRGEEEVAYAALDFNASTSQG